MQSIAAQRLVSALILTLGFIGAAAAPALRAQEPPPLPKADLSQEDPATLKMRDLFLKYMATWKGEDLDAKERERQDVILGSLVAEMEKFEKERKVGSVLADDVTWAKWFAMSYTERIKTGKDKAPAAKGTIKEEYVERNERGSIMRYDYAYSLPSGYTAEKSWPLLLCLHDKDCLSGKDYIRNIWDDDKESKDIRESFIIVAPTLHEKTPSGESKHEERGKKLTVARVEWFDQIHLRQLLLPVGEMRKRFNCDPARFYVEGVGRGGQAAFQLAALNPNPGIAAAVLRNAQPRDTKLLGGFKDRPVLFLYREGGPADTADAVKYWQDIASEAKNEGVKTFRGLEQKRPKLEKITPKVMGGQATEPLKDANKDVWAFLSEHKLDVTRSTFRIVSNNGAFLQNGMLKLRDPDLESGQVDCLVEVDKAANTIKLTGRNFSAYTLFLNDSIVDLDKPVEIYLNGALLAKKKVERSFTFMTKYMDGYRYAPLRVATCYIAGEVPVGPTSAPAESQPAAPGAGDGDGEKK
jgi:hypothetical protein